MCFGGVIPIISREREREREWRIVDEPAESFARLLAPTALLPDSRQVFRRCFRRAPRQPRPGWQGSLSKHQPNNPTEITVVERMIFANSSRQQKNLSHAVSPLQGSLQSTLGCSPTTAGSAQFCLFCCQPEPMPESLPARAPSLSRG